MNTQEEIWKEIEGYDGKYEVSTLGKVKSFYKKEKILIPGLCKNGYFVINLFKNKKSSTKYLHKLVAMSFLNHEPCVYKLVINHINHIKTDNRVKNLEIVTQRENCSKRKCQYTSKYIGVYWNKWTKKWISQIKINKKSTHIGSFSTEIEAYNAYKEKLKSIL